MNVELFALCDKAGKEGDKLSILGVCDYVKAVKVPIVIPAFQIAVRLRFLKIEEGDHTLVIVLIDRDGNFISQRAERKITVSVPPGQTSCVVNIAMQCNGVRLSYFGEYAMHLAIDGLQLVSVPLFAQEI